MITEEYKNKLKEAREKEKLAAKEVRDLEQKCPHIFKDKETAICDICGICYGHYCPESPDKTCHYYTNEDSKIELLNGSLVDPGEHWDGKTFENYDCCVFCGDPDERK